MNTPFSKVEFSEDNCFIFMYGKKDATWEEMNTYLEQLYRNDPHLKWRGFGEIGTETF